MKQLVWIFTVFTLIVGWHHCKEDLWVTLLVLLLIDIPSTQLLNRDIRRGKPYGDPVKDVTNYVTDEIKDTIIEKTLTSMGIPEHMAEGYIESKSAKEEVSGKSDLSLGCRAWANVIWTFGLLILSIYCIYKWW